MVIVDLQLHTENKTWSCVSTVVKCWGMMENRLERKTSRNAWHGKGITFACHRDVKVPYLAWCGTFDWRLRNGLKTPVSPILSNLF